MGLGWARSRCRGGIVYAARRHPTVRLEALADHGETELVEAAEPGQVRAGQGSVSHGEVFRARGVTTFILRRPRPDLDPHPRSDAPNPTRSTTVRYTLNRKSHIK